MKNITYESVIDDAPDSASSWQRPSESLSSTADTSPHAAARGFGQVFGLHAATAALTLGVNAMMFGAEAVTMGTAFPAALAAAVVLAFITYKAQKKWYGDDHDSALLKALSVGLLTCIPSGLPALLTAPSAVVGIIHTLRSKAQ